MSHIVGISEIVLWTANKEQALGFYRDLLGLELISPRSDSSARRLLRRLAGRLVARTSTARAAVRRRRRPPQPGGVTALNKALAPLLSAFTRKTSE